MGALHGLVVPSTRRRPFPYPRQTAGSAMALLFLVGALTTLLTLALPHPTAVHDDVLLVCGSTAPVAAAVVYCFRDRLPLWSYHGFLATGTVIVTILTAAGAGGTTSISFTFFYLWIVMYAMLFFSPILQAVHMGLAATAYGAVLWWLRGSDSGTFSAVEPIVLVSVIATTGGIVQVLSRARETSEVDPLTQVANRRGFDRVLDQAMATALADREPLVLAMIDIDHFKEINDTRGHHEGDLVLRELANSWRAALRVGDTIARFGGDEFVVVLPDCTPDAMLPLLERLRAAAPEGVTCSVGAVLWRPGDSATMTLLGADSALYEAKRQGRNRVVARDGRPAASPVEPRAA